MPSDVTVYLNDFLVFMRFLGFERYVLMLGVVFPLLNYWFFLREFGVFGRWTAANDPSKYKTIWDDFTIKHVVILSQTWCK